MEVQWSLVLFTAIAGAGAWQFAWSTIQWLAGKDEAPSKMETIVAFALVVVGGIMSVTHLKHVDRIFEALNRPTSGIFVEAALVGVICVILAIFFIMLVRGVKGGALKAVAVIGMVVGVVFTFMCGSSYMMAARAAWNTVMLPLAYCGTAAAAGAGVNLCCKAVQKHEGESTSFAGLLALVGGVIGAVCALAYCAVAGGALGQADGAVPWIAILFVALVVAIAGGYLAWKKPANMGIVAIVLIAGIAAAIALRVVMWLVGVPTMNLFLMPLD